MHILVIDDDAKPAEVAAPGPGDDGPSHHRGARRHEQAQDLLGNRALFDVAFLDLRLASEQGLELLPDMLRLGARRWGWW